MTNSLKKIKKLQEMQELAKKRNGRCLSKEYIGYLNYLEWQCEKGHIWKAKPQYIKIGKWCRKCYHDSNRATIEEMQELAKKRNGKCLSKKYINCSTNLEWQCEKRHKWKATPQNIKAGSWCKECFKNRKKYNLKDLKEEAKKRNGRCLSKEYINNKTKLEWKCHNGHTWKMSFYAVKFRNQWCPKCSGSIMEEKCRYIIESISGLKFPKNRKVIKPLELDGFNEEFRIAFEYNGEQHYDKDHIFYSEDLIIRDKEKESLCNINSIRLLTIPYWKAKNDQELYSYIYEFLIKENIKIKKDSFIEIINSFIGIPSKLKEMKELAKKKNGKCLSKKYINSITPLKWKCDKGHIWKARSSDVKQNKWCSICANNKRKTIEEMQEIAKERNGKCLSKKYINNRTKLEWQCEKGHIWEAAPCSIYINNSWCPECYKNTFNKGKI